MFTQSSYVMLERAVSLEAVEKALGRDDWRDRATIDVLSHPWNDTLGDPKKDPATWKAWQAGELGPCVFPGNLERARQHVWAWQQGKAAAKKHQALVRLRTTSSTKEGEERDALAELLLLTELSLALLEKLDGALCYWNPNGESLRGKEILADTLERHRKGGPPPFEVWANVRLHEPTEAKGWQLMDTVGMEQLGVSDQEVGFPKGRMEHGAVDDFLRSAALYLFENGPVIEDNDTMDGPGLKLQAYSFESGLVQPPRETIRWLPISPRPPESLLENE